MRMTAERGVSNEKREKSRGTKEKGGAEDQH